MACSPAQRESNRRNAQLSTGPRTPEGKAISRRNGLKHGLTGAGIVLPGEDSAEVDGRLAALEVEMAPRGELARQLVKRVALITVRLDRCAEHEAKATAYRMRRAEAEFEDARLAEIEASFSWLAREPATHARRLRGSPEGVDRLIEGLEGLRGDVDHADGARWDWAHCEHLHHLLGRRRLEIPVTRARALGEAILGDPQHLGPADRPDLDPLDRRCWAAAELIKLIDREVTALEALRWSLDLEPLGLDRSEAAARALFDPSPAATLARKYEAAAERGLFRALREFRDVQAEAPSPTPEPEPEPESPTIDDELGSSLPGPPGDEDEQGDVDTNDPRRENPAAQGPAIVPNPDSIDDR